MSFPLPRGSCRTVCRPARENQYANTQFAVRAAVAAVARGANACDVSRAVADAVSCSPRVCVFELENLLVSASRVTETSQQFMDAVGKLGMDWGIMRKMPEAPRDDPWWQVFVETFKIVFKIVDFVIDIIAVVNAGWELLDATYIMILDSEGLARCLSETQSQS